MNTQPWVRLTATIGLKFGAYLLTDSVGLLSDAAESVVNLVAAIVALFVLHIAAKPADKNHNFGHSKAEYFSAWKNSRFIAGSKAAEKGFVAASRLQDIGDILGGLDLIYANVRPVVEKADTAQAEQTGAALKELLAFVTRLRDEEANGKRFTASDAETLGSEAQDKAEAIAGQITQVAEQLGIELQT